MAWRTAPFVPKIKKVQTFAPTFIAANNMAALRAMQCGSAELRRNLEAAMW
jgi:hypothetical protein